MEGKAKEHFEVWGRADSAGFQTIVSVSQLLEEQFPGGASYTFHPLDPAQWNFFVKRTQREDPDLTVDLEKGHLLYNTQRTIVGDKTVFAAFVYDTFGYEFEHPESYYHELAKESFIAMLRSRKHDFVYMDLACDGEVLGRMLIELYTDFCPKGCENFQRLCQGTEGGVGYEETPIHRVVKGGWLQGGDVVSGAGNGYHSAFPEQEVFEDECFELHHNRPGVVGYVNKGRHSNSSQFYITFAEAEWMDHKYEAFGVVVLGMPLLKQVESLSTRNQRPNPELTISQCGLLDLSSTSQLP